MIFSFSCASSGEGNSEHGFPDNPDKWIAITFDDGPSGNTPRLLDFFKANNITATFFVTANKLNANTRAIVQRMLEEGHEVANHGYGHPNMSTWTKEQVEEELSKASANIKNTTGSDPIYFRIPFGASSPFVVQVATEMGMAILGWDIDPKDWDNSSSSVIVNRVLNIENVRDGSILLFHDYGNTNTIRAMPEIITELRKRGFGFINVGELAELKGVTLNPGQNYNRFD